MFCIVDGEWNNEKCLNKTESSAADFYVNFVPVQEASGRKVQVKDSKCQIN